MMETRELLEAARTLDREVLGKIEHLNHLRKIGEGLSHKDLAGQGKGAAVQLDEMCRELDHSVVELLDKKQALTDRIALLEHPNHRTVLQLRYLCGYTWEDIAEKMSFSCMHVQRIHRQALQELETGCGRL